MSQQDKLNSGIHSIAERFSGAVRRLRRYNLLIFLLFVGCIYGFIILRANDLNSTRPSADAVTGQVKAARLPHIDQAVVQQLQTLRDNSVNVQALFDQERNNPFQ